MSRHRPSWFAASLLLALAAPAFPALAQLRVATWNVTNYASNGTSPSNSRDADFQNAIYGVVPAGLALSGLSMSPDVLICSEFQTATAATTFRGLLNSAPGSPGDWAAAPFLDGPDTDSAFFYRTSKVQYLGTWTIALGASGDNCEQPRHTRRYDFRPIGYSAPGASIGAYSVHLKAQGSNSACPAGENAEGRRLLECQRIRDNAQGVDTNPSWIPPTGLNPAGSSALPAGFNFIMAGDTNIQSSSRPDYQELVGSQTVNLGRFFDPINAPGTWNNASGFRFIHTQDPAVQVDDRHDQILMSASLLDRNGLDYIFVPDALGAPRTFSAATWNDPNHTYRCWGNDGGSFNTPLRTTGNVMVGAAIAQSLKSSAATGGHLPVYADLRVPAKLATASALGFGQVQLNAPAAASLSVSNGGDVAKWTINGIDTLRYSFAVTGPFSIAGGQFTDAPGGGANAHVVTMSTTSAGLKSGALIITSNDPDQPSRVIMLSGEVISSPPPCPADFNADGVLDPDDLSDYIGCFFGSPACPAGDFNHDGVIDPDDLSDYIGAFFAGC